MSQEKLYAQYRKWRTQNLSGEEGIVVGTDLTQEWLLPWWWEHYRRTNVHPVAFVDFGMTDEMKKWCQEKGELITLAVADIFVAEKETIDPSLVGEMENCWGKTFWASRNAWFKKPLACLQSPFRRSIWIDLDCQILGSLQVLFSLCTSGIAMVRESEEKKFYNSGLIVFDQGLPVIEQWADQAFESNHKFPGDQDILNACIQEQDLPIVDLSPIYNWSRMKGPNPQAVVLHWHGPQGKTQIIHQIARNNLKSLDLVQDAFSAL